MTRLIAAFVRHGDYHQRADTPSAHQPHPLNEDGFGHARAGAQMVRAAIMQNGWVLHPEIDTSTLLRAWQTARCLAEGLADCAGAPLRLVEFDALAERGLGSAANLTHDEIEAVVRADPRFESLPPGWKSDSTFRLPLPGAESLVDAGKRVARHVAARMDLLPDSEGAERLKVFVGHGGAFRHAAAALGVLEWDEVPGLSMYHGRPVFLARDDDGKWTHVGGDWKVRDRNLAPKD